MKISKHQNDVQKVANAIDINSYEFLQRRIYLMERQRYVTHIVTV